jgi:hypothetical protein
MSHAGKDHKSGKDDRRAPVRWHRRPGKVFPCNVISMWKYYLKSIKIASDLFPMAY